MLWMRKGFQVVIESHECRCSLLATNHPKQLSSCSPRCSLHRNKKVKMSAKQDVCQALFSIHCKIHGFDLESCCRAQINK